jgi:hypothetical protein
LKDSNFVFISDDGTKISIFKLKGGDLEADIRRDWREYGGATPEDVVMTFSQPISLRMQCATATFVMAGYLSQGLMEAYKGDNKFEANLLPFGLRGAQRLDFLRQDRELAPLRQQRLATNAPSSLLNQEGTTDGLLDVRRLWFGGQAELFMEVNTSLMASHGVVKYLVHEFSTNSLSYQVFANVKHTAFVKLFEEAAEETMSTHLVRIPILPKEFHN